MKPAAEIVPELEVHFDKDERGQVLSSLIVYRKGVKVVRSIQPNPNCQILFLLGADDLLVAIQALESVDGVAVQQIFVRLLEDAAGKVVGVDRNVTSHFLTAGEIEQLAAAWRRALAPLQKSTACPVG